MFRGRKGLFWLIFICIVLQLMPNSPHSTSAQQVPRLLSAGNAHYGGADTFEQILDAAHLNLANLDDPLLAEPLLDRLSEMAFEAERRGALLNAEQLFRLILNHDPDRINETAALGKVLVKQLKTSEAIEFLRSARRRFPHSAHLISLLGQAYLQNEQESRAVNLFERAYSIDPHTPDVGYYLGERYLKWGNPVDALNAMMYAPTSTREIGWSQDLTMGGALGKLNLLSEATSHYRKVLSESSNEYLTGLAAQYLNETNEALVSREWLRGSLKITSQYDNDPGIVPTFNSVGVPAKNSRSSAGNQYLLRLSYDLVRSYNYDVTLGYTFHSTQNYRNHNFDLLDNVAYLLIQRRLLWRDQPTYTGVRIDYDYLTLGNQSFVQRPGVAPYITMLEDDWTSTTYHGRIGMYDYFGQGIFNGTAFDLDSLNGMVGMTRARKFGRERNKLLSLGYQFDVNSSDGRNNAYQGHKFTSNVLWNLPGDDVQMSMSAEYYLRKYNDPHTFFLIERSDREVLLVGSLLYEMRPQLFLTFDVVYDHNRSNLSLNTYKHLTYDLGVEYRFPRSWARRSREIP